MTPDEILRFARQIALPEVGPDGQARLCAARVLVAGQGPAAEVVAAYLAAAGVAEVIAREIPPDDGAAWAAALAAVDLVVRVGFDDDAMLGAAARRGLPAVVVRAEEGVVDLLSFPGRAPAADDANASWEIPPRAAAPSKGGPAAVLAGALAATAALTRLTGIDGDHDRIRHLHLPLDGSAPLAQTIGLH